MNNIDIKNAKHKPKLNDKYNLFAIQAALVIIGTLFISLMLKPDSTAQLIENMKRFSVKILAPYYLWLALIVVFYMLYFCISKYGNIRFGKEKPEYSTFSWLVMIFCAGIGSSMLYWSALEWIYYYSAPPLGAKPFSQLAAELSITYGSFHWSITAWALYGVGAITLSQRYYIRKKPDLTLTACCEEAIGEKRAAGICGKIIETIFVLGILGGLSTTLALGVPMLTNNVSSITGWPDNFTMQVGMMLLVTLIFVITSWIGLEKGMKILSDWNAYIAIALAIFILIVGPTLFEIESLTNSLGFMFQNFIHMSLWLDPIGKSGFPESWTAFYWAWWLGLGPWMWIFITKISKGRTMREMILGVLICGSLGCWLYFGTVSNYGLYQQLSGNLDLVSILKTQGGTAAISAMLGTLPFPKFITFVWLVVGIMFLASTMDSAAYTLAASTTKNLGEDEHPSRVSKLFWSLLLIAVPLGYLFAKASLTALQSLAVLTSVPIAFLTVFVMISGYKYAKADFSHLSAEEIKAKCEKL